jgi:hypothetical protein
MATAKTSDFITRGRQMLAQFMSAFGTLRAYEYEAATTGLIVVDPTTGQVSMSNLTQGDFVGANAEVDVDDFTESVAVIMRAAVTVSAEDAAKIYRSQA